MSIIRTKNNVPQVYVSESRDFQIFTRVLDFVQNAIKYDIDSMTDTLSTEDMSEEYIDYLKSKVGFYTSKTYDDTSLRKVLSAMPYISKNKGSTMGIEMCVHTFLNIIGFRKGYTISIYNNDDRYKYTVRIGIEGSEINIDILKDMLSYVIPTGYFVEFYFYTSVKFPATKSVFETNTILMPEKDTENYTNRIGIIRNTKDSDSSTDETIEDDTYGTLYLTTVTNLPQTTPQDIDEGDDISNE